MNASEIAESIVGEIEWKTESMGYCRCPGITNHTKPNGKRNTRIFIDGAPTITCFHSSCSNAVDVANLALRRAMSRGVSDKSFHVIDFVKKGNAAREKADIERRRSATAAAFSSIISSNPWSEADAANESLPLGEGRDSCRLLLSALYDPSEMIFIGRKYDTGKRHIRPAGEWVDLDPTGPLMMPNPLRPGSTDKSAASVLEHRFICLESDSLAREEQFPLMRYFMRHFQLVAIIDSGCVSLHAWFRHPGKHAVFLLKELREELAIDKSGLLPTQHSRLPGAIRSETGRQQKLLYLNPR